jgi:hypothetical protein
MVTWPSFFCELQAYSLKFPSEAWNWLLFVCSPLCLPQFIYPINQSLPSALCPMINPFALFSTLLGCYEFRLMIKKSISPFSLISLMLTVTLLCSIACCFSGKLPKKWLFLHRIHYFLHTLLLLVLILEAAEQDTLPISALGTTLTLFVHQIPPILQIHTLEFFTGQRVKTNVK